ncbi:MAG: hypothetical protein AABZ57_00960, partial [Candidatus Margulisiibacteriota bacterium]
MWENLTDQRKIVKQVVFALLAVSAGLWGWSVEMASGFAFFAVLGVSMKTASIESVDAQTRTIMDFILRVAAVEQKEDDAPDKEDLADALLDLRENVLQMEQEEFLTFIKGAERGVALHTLRIYEHAETVTDRSVQPFIQIARALAEEYDIPFFLL